MVNPWRWVGLFIPATALMIAVGGLLGTVVLNPMAGSGIRHDRRHSGRLGFIYDRPAHRSVGLSSLAAQPPSSDGGAGTTF
ncbi:MAG: hypothetical protein M0R03_06295 [Novosphingobium sp.]|nr:hypothetical protein [Novosphingobium sp.]